MDIFSKIELHVEKNNRAYQFSIPVGAPYGEACDALFECIEKLTDMMKEAASKSKPVEAQQPQGE